MRHWRGTVKQDKLTVELADRRRLSVRVRYGPSALFGKLMLSSRKEDDVLMATAQIKELLAGRPVKVAIRNTVHRIQKVE